MLIFFLNALLFNSLYYDPWLLFAILKTLLSFLYFYLRFKFLVSLSYMFLYLWLQYFWWEVDPIELGPLRKPLNIHATLWQPYMSSYVFVFKM